MRYMVPINSRAELKGALPTAKFGAGEIALPLLQWGLPICKPLPQTASGRAPGAECAGAVNRVRIIIVPIITVIFMSNIPYQYL